ncbi:cysteine--tRNA ligase [Devosia sp. Root413D1]|uniref:cysteine--tRNA ligase n=1 Tax=Devosia sp. Root413D1 TaxID=1736531 RepID=UPI0007020C2A|nr:cysteine--tRNA ligase [Devosia sp. Root413D1]KQW80354.1 cysteine--tRNA ligase [Devosia sp. Root413D1]
MGQTTLKLHNTLTRAKEDFVPIDPNNVRMYVCGPTVYDYAHIGNARPVIVFDLLYRLLRHVYGAAHVTYVRNITDVDDKINARAVRDYPGLPLNEAIRKVTEETANQYFKDVAALGTLEPDHQPRATDHIPGMQSLITSLIGSRHAYEAAGEVLFDVGSMPDYGRLSGRNLDDNLAGARIAVEAHKKNPADFVLWKQSSPEEPGWESPWGRGRPGWHIECSAMSERYLGQLFDIHAGGLDLIFPHHENEIAQSRCAHGTPAMANYWLHNGFLQVEGQKMSKSLGNFITISELLETEKFGGRKWPGEVLRLAMLMTHYREPIDFSVKRLEEAEQKLRDWQRAAQARPGTPPEPSVIAELTDDLNFHRASVALDAIARKANRGTETAANCLAATLEFLGFTTDGLLTAAAADAPEGVAEAVAARLAALNAKDFAKADTIRAQLLTQGVQLMDYKDEAGQRQTKWEVVR